MLAISDLLETIRDRLGDSNKTGWSDDRLIRLINSAQKDICKITSIYRDKHFISLSNGVTIYSLPEECYNISRLEYNGQQLPIYSREDIDKVLKPPELYAIKSNINRGVIEIHPAFTDLSDFGGFYTGFSVEDNIVVNQLTGVVTGVEGPDSELCNPLGVMANMYRYIFDAEETKTYYGDICGTNLFNRVNKGANEGVLAYIDSESELNQYGFTSAINTNHVNGLYGITSSFSFDPNVIVVYYSAIPPRVTWENGSLILDDIWFDAIVHYAVGTARQDDNDEGNYRIGERELLKYDKEVFKAKKISAKSNNSQVSVVRDITYRRF